jgi:hypothetical protein
VLRSRTNLLKLIVMIVPMVFLHSACSKTVEPARTNEPAPRVEPVVAPIARLLPPPTPTPTPAPAPKSSEPPSATEVIDAVARVFNKVVTADTARDNSFVVGDFNGDGSEDLAVVVKPGAGSLGEINSDLANWVLEDPRSIPLTKTGSTTLAPPGKPVRAEKGDALLAIIHGVGPQGWRAPEAKQTYVLKNAAGSWILAQSSNDLRKAGQKLPPLRGDVLNEKLAGKSGFVFWTGAKYAWWASPAD